MQRPVWRDIFCPTSQHLAIGFDNLVLGQVKATVVVISFSFNMSKQKNIKGFFIVCPSTRFLRMPRSPWLLKLEEIYQEKCLKGSHSDLLGTFRQFISNKKKSAFKKINFRGYIFNLICKLKLNGDRTSHSSNFYRKCMYIVRMYVVESCI